MKNDKKRLCGFFLERPVFLSSVAALTPSISREPDISASERSAAILLLQQWVHYSSRADQSAEVSQPLFKTCSRPLQAVAAWRARTTTGS